MLGEFEGSDTDQLLIDIYVQARSIGRRALKPESPGMLFYLRLPVMNSGQGADNKCGTTACGKPCDSSSFGLLALLLGFIFTRFLLPSGARCLVRNIMKLEGEFGRLSVESIRVRMGSNRVELTGCVARCRWRALAKFRATSKVAAMSEMMTIVFPIENSVTSVRIIDTETKVTSHLDPCHRPKGHLDIGEVAVDSRFLRP